MSWNMRDRRGEGQGSDPLVGPRVTPPAPIFDDVVPLPTYVSGMEYADADYQPPMAAWQRRLLVEQGLLPDALWDRWASLMRRGIPEV